MKYKKYQIFCNNFIKDFSSFQRELLEMNLKMAEQGFDRLYNEAIPVFEQFKETIAGSSKGTQMFLFYSQAHLILKNIQRLKIANQQLSVFEDVEIIRYFEQQFKLKKIINKHISGLGSA